MSQLVCEKVTPGLRASERTVTVRDIHNRRHFLRVEADFLTHEAGKDWLPVGKVYEDRDKKLTLIELPQEAENGANRFWVRSSDLLESLTGDPA